MKFPSNLNFRWKNLSLNEDVIRDKSTLDLVISKPQCIGHNELTEFNIPSNL